MRTALAMIGLALLTALPSSAENRVSLPAVADEHGGHIMTKKEVYQELMDYIGADKDPAAPPVADKMTPELLAYLTRNMSKLPAGDVCYVLYSITDMKFKEARSEVVAFMVRNRDASGSVCSALRAIGEPEDAVPLAKIAARHWSVWGDTEVEKTVEGLAGDNVVVWRQVAEVNDPRLKALAAKHMLIGAADVTVNEVAALFKASHVFVRQTILVAFSLDKRPEMFPVILLAVEDSHATIASSAVAHLKGYKPSDSERRALIEAAERLYATGVMHPRLTAASLAACLGDPHGFDWALECLQDFNDSGQEKYLIDGRWPDGIPGQLPRIFFDYDRPGFPNFLRLVRKAEKPQALRDVADVLSISVEINQGVQTIGISADSDDGKALRRGLEEIGTDLSREVLTSVFKEIPKPDPLAGLSEEQRKAALAHVVTEKDFIIEVGRRPFERLNAVEFRLKKVTPGLFVGRRVTLSTYWSGSEGQGKTRFKTIGGGYPWVRFQRADQGGTMCAEGRVLSPKDWPPGTKLQVSFWISPLHGGDVNVEAAFTQDQLRPDPAGDADEFIRRLNSPDPEVSGPMEGLFATPSRHGYAHPYDRPYEPVELPAEAREPVRNALLKKIEDIASVDPPPRSVALYFPDTGVAQSGPVFCMASLDRLGTGGMETERFLRLMNARDFRAAGWACGVVRGRWANEQSKEAAEARMVELLQEKARSGSPYEVRNATLLLVYALASRQEVDYRLDDLVRTLARSESPMVRAAAATLVALRGKLFQSNVLFNLAEDADPVVARSAIVGLAEFVNIPYKINCKDVVTVYDRLLAGGDKERLNAIKEALGKVKHPAFVPLMYRLARQEEVEKPGGRYYWLGFSLDGAASAFLLDRLAEDPSDRAAAGYLVAGGYVWPPDTRAGRLQKLVRSYWPERSPVAWAVPGAVARLLAAEKDDRRAAEAFAALFRKHLREGDYRKAAEDALILTSLGQKTDAPFARLLLAPEDRSSDEINQPNTGLVAVLALYETDREAARAPLLELLNEADLREHPALVAFARQTNWPDVLALVQEAPKE